MVKLRTKPLLLELIASNGAQLQEVSTRSWLDFEDLQPVLAAAPRLQMLKARVKGRCMELLPVLRNGPVRFSGMLGLLEGAAEPEVLAFAAAVAAHESLNALSIKGVGSARGANALMDAAVQLRVSLLRLEGASCVLDAKSVPALARSLQHCSLTFLEVSCSSFPHASEASVLVLCAALRACRTLEHLVLRLNPPNGTSNRTVTEVLDAAASLPALSELCLPDSVFQDVAAAGRAFGALLAANPPVLNYLNVDRCSLGDEGMAPLLDGLAANTHLPHLHCRDNGVSEAFERDRLAPALAVLKTHPRRQRLLFEDPACLLQ